MNAQYFNPQTDLAWYRDNTFKHCGETERAVKSRWKVKIEGIRRKKAANKIIQKTTTNEH